MTLSTSVAPDMETQFKAKNRAMALVLLEECYDKAIADSAPFAAKMDLLKLNVKLGELEPKQAVLPLGNGIQFIINLPQTGVSPASTVTIEGSAPQDAEDAVFSMLIDEIFPENPPPRPDFLPESSALTLATLENE